MKRLVLAVAVLLLAGASANAGCDTPENRQACWGDAMSLCASAQSVPQAITCLKRNRWKLSRPCAAALSACQGVRRHGR